MAGTSHTCEGVPPVAAFSGTDQGTENPDDTAMENVGPLPRGTYYLVDRQSGGLLGFIRDWWSAHGRVSTDRHEWFMLWNPVSGDTTNVNGIRRGNFRLHPMGRMRLSEGCIMVNSPYEFERLQKFIRSRGLHYRCRAEYAWASCRSTVVPDGREPSRGS